MKLIEKAFEERRMVGNQEVVVQVRIHGNCRDLCVDVGYDGDFFQRKGKTYTAAGTKHFIVDDAVRLAESVRLFFTEAGLFFCEVKDITVTYMKETGNFSVQCMGIKENGESFSEEQQGKLDFLMRVFENQSRFSLRYMEHFWLESLNG